jgi:Fe-Mn family superoxide dismutase
MSPNGGGQPGGELGAAITATFGSFEKFKEEFSNAGANRSEVAGHGWLLPPIKN